MRITENQLRKVIREVIKESMLNEMDLGFSYDSAAIRGAAGHAKSFEEMMATNILDLSKQKAIKLMTNLTREATKNISNIPAPKGNFLDKIRRMGRKLSPLDKVMLSIYASIIPGYSYVISHKAAFEGAMDPSQGFAYLAAGTLFLLLLEAFLYGNSHSKANMIINKLPKKQRMELEKIVNNQVDAKEAGYSDEDIAKLKELHKKIEAMNDEHMLMKPDLNQKH